MALPASSVFAPTPKFQTRLLNNKSCQFHKWGSLCTSTRLSPTRFTKIRNAQFEEPNKIKSQMCIGAKRLWEVTPEPVKDFPWRKAGDAILKRLLSIGQTTLKWSFVTFFTLSSISDVIFSITKNQELMIPIGLLVGCLMTDFLKEILQELLETSEDKKMNKPFVLISCFCVLVKFVSTYFATQTHVFLLHVANGGLLQVLWLWRNLSTKNDEHKERFLTGQDASLPSEA